MEFIDINDDIVYVCIRSFNTLAYCSRDNCSSEAIDYTVSEGSEFKVTATMKNKIFKFSTLDDTVYGIIVDDDNKYKHFKPKKDLEDLNRDTYICIHKVNSTDVNCYEYRWVDKFIYLGVECDLTQVTTETDKFGCETYYYLQRDSSDDYPFKVTEDVFKYHFKKLNKQEDYQQMSETTNKEQDLSGVTLLGNQNTKYKFDYDPSILEKFEKKFDDSTEDEQVVSLDCFEFASRCPKTGQPDFATIHISYIPNTLMVESKSLKLYLFSFQQHGDFHESCVHMIMQDLVDLLQPKYLEVYGDFNSRGGICITPFSVYADENHQEMKKARQLAMMQYAAEHRPRTGR